MKQKVKITTANSGVHGSFFVGDTPTLPIEVANDFERCGYAEKVGKPIEEGNDSGEGAMDDVKTGEKSGNDKSGDGDKVSGTGDKTDSDTSGKDDKTKAGDKGKK